MGEEGTGVAEGDGGGGGGVHGEREEGGGAVMVHGFHRYWELGSYGNPRLLGVAGGSHAGSTQPVLTVLVSLEPQSGRGAL